MSSKHVLQQIGNHIKLVNEEYIRPLSGHKELLTEKVIRGLIRDTEGALYTLNFHAVR